MKKFIYIMLMACGLFATTANAQILKGDMNDDGVLDVIDINASSATILGQQEKQYINPGVNPFTVDNSLVAGIWWLNKTEHFSLMANGSTDYDGATTYEFMPYQGRIRFIDAEGETMSWMSVIKLADGHMWCALDGQSSLVAYTSPRPAANLDGNKPFTVDNSLVAGIWWRNVNTHFSLADDGKTDYDGAATYEFYPYQGRIVYMDANGVPVSWMTVAKLNNGRMWVAPNGQSTLVAYSTTRPDAKLVTSIQLTDTKLELDINESKQVTAVVLPNDADNKTIIWSSSNESVAKVTNGNIHAVAVGTATITCSATDGSGVKATCEVKVECEYVDLGLPGGVLWATCNVGAIKPEDAGKYFAWGDTVGYAKNEEHNFDWAHYKWCNGSEETLTKYYYTDHKEILDTEDDAATANWGSEWRMPTSQELCDLIDSDYTTVVVEKVNGVKCCKITSKKNGNSILLPPSGVREDSYVLWDTHNGRYWSREKFISDSSYAYHLEFQIELTSNECTSVVFRDGRYKGITIRPVRVSTK